MLRGQISTLSISDNEILADCKLDFSPALNVITGPSGSGKSVLLSLILSIFGLKDGRDISAFVTLPLASRLDEIGIKVEGEFCVKILGGAKARYLIDDEIISKKKLKELFLPYIYYITQTSIKELDEAYLLSLLDGQNKRLSVLKLKFSKVFYAFIKEKEHLEELEASIAKIEELKDFARFECEKIERIDPKEGELEALLVEKKLLSKKEKIASALEEIGDISAMQGAIARLYALLGKDALELEEGFLNIEANILDARELLESESDPEVLLDRIEELSSLVRRYGGIANAREHLRASRQKLLEYENINIDLEETRARVKVLKAEVEAAARALNALRDKELASLIKSLGEITNSLLLKELSAVLKKCEEIDAQGGVRLEINLGKASIKELSSGEFNRLRLALMALEATGKELGENSPKILLFDEIDANLSGVESEGLALCLRRLSLSYQIFAISHQPNLPSFANAHFLIQGGSSKSTITRLSGAAIEGEIARMISGARLSDEALAFAKARLEEARAWEVANLGTEAKELSALGKKSQKEAQSNPHSIKKPPKGIESKSDSTKKPKRNKR